MDKKLQPLVSIITPCYNSAAFVAKTIQSVIAQTYQQWELLVIDDCSTDNTCAVVEGFMVAEPRIKLIKLAQNGRVANARNIGLDNANGKYIAFLDSDDIWLDNKLAVQISFMEQNQLPMTFCAYRRIDEGGKVISRLINVPTSVDYSQLLSHNVIIFTTSVTLKTAIGNLRFKKVGHEDWVFWLDLFKQGYKGYGIKQELALYRIRKGSVSNNKIKAAGFTWKIYRETEQLSLIRSIYHFSRYAASTVIKYLK